MSYSKESQRQSRNILIVNESNEIIDEKKYFNDHEISTCIQSTEAPNTCPIRNFLSKKGKGYGILDKTKKTCLFFF